MLLLAYATFLFTKPNGIVSYFFPLLGSRGDILSVRLPADCI